MNPNPDSSVLEALAKWRRLVEAEGQAILTRNWRALSECQDSLQQLQADLSARVQSAQQAWQRLGIAGQERRDTFRNILLELTDLHHRNKTWLMAQQQQVADRLSQLDATSSNLRRIRRSYTPSPTPEWSSVS